MLDGATRYPSIMRKSTISIIGAGRSGRALGRRLRKQGWKIHSVVTRSQATARRAVRSIGAGSGSGEVSPSVLSASVILISVPDSAISAVVNRLATFDEADLQSKTVLHTSGALSSKVLERLRPLGAAIGSIHPLQTFSGVGIPAMDGRIFAIEGDPAAIRVARAITRALGGQPLLMAAPLKPLYHAAAAISAGHVLALQESAIRIFISLGMKRQEALKAALPLTRQVLENLEHIGARAAWTGPLARGDYSVIAMHEDALKPFPLEYLDAYRAVNRLAARLLARDSDSVLRELARVSSKTDFPIQIHRSKRVKPFHIPIEHKTLANGLRVVVAPDSTAPVVTVGVYYKIGFRLEPQGRSGFAHLFEHMMFQGSANAPKMQHIKLINSSAGVLNGSTSYHVRNHYQAVPSNALQRVLWLEADRMRALKVDDENLKNQRDVVKEEVRVNVMNQPYGGFPWLDVPPVAFGNWANAHNFYGAFAAIEAADFAALPAFFKI